MAQPTNFHNSAIIAHKITASEKYNKWIIRKKSSRKIHYRFSPHYHPYTDDLIETLNRDGLPALLDATYHKSLVLGLNQLVYTGTIQHCHFPKMK